MKRLAAFLLLLSVSSAGTGRPLTEFNLFLGLARAGGDLVAVGERGSIVRSVDEGRTWHVSDSPVSSTLCAVAFVDAKRGFACGHEGALLATEDGGVTWRERTDVLAPEQSGLALAAEGERLLLTGAFGLLASSEDAGRNWKVLPEPEAGPHIYAASPYRGGWLLAGEMGFLAHLAGDGTLSVFSVDAPSLHTLLPTPGGSYLAAGIRGHAIIGNPADGEWKALEVGATQLAAASAELDDGRILIAGQSGLWQISEDQGRTFNAARVPDGITGVAALLTLGDGGLLVAGESGLLRVDQGGRKP